MSCDRLTQRIIHTCTCLSPGLLRSAPRCASQCAKHKVGEWLAAAEKGDDASTTFQKVASRLLARFLRNVRCSVYHDESAPRG